MVDPTKQSAESNLARDARRRRLTYLSLGLATLVVSFVALGVGHGSLHDAHLRDTLLSLRAVRVAAAFLTGAGLAVAGVLVQGLFRNPLASPSVLGTTAGASLGGQAALIAFQLVLAGHAPSLVRPALLMPMGCLLGSFASLLILLAIAKRHTDLMMLLLVGFILSSLLLSIGDFIMSLAQETWELGRAMVAFVLGGLGNVGADQVLVGFPLMFAGIAAAFFWGRPLDLMLSGDEEAASLGVDVPGVRLWAVVWTSVLTGAAVSIGGNVGFVGLIVPHALRPFVGVEHRKLVPAAALAGGAFLVVCDVLSRALPTRSEIPLGVVTGLLGAPVFLSLLLRVARGEEHV